MILYLMLGVENRKVNVLTYTAITMLIVAEFTEREGNEMSKNNKPVRERVGRKYL
jgi:hypothetical protein